MASNPARRGCSRISAARRASCWARRGGHGGSLTDELQPTGGDICQRQWACYYLFMSLSPAMSLLRHKKPNLLIGFLLNLLMPGAGFTYIDQPRWHIFWLSVFVIGFFLGGLIHGVVLSLIFMLAIVLVIELHYFLGYRSYFRDGQLPEPMNNSVRWVLIGAHILPGLWGMVFLSNMIHYLPREKVLMERIEINSYAQELKIELMFNGGLLYKGSCIGFTKSPLIPKNIQSCMVLHPYSHVRPTIHIVETDGQVLDYP